MAQRYPPTKFYDPVFDDVDAAALQTTPWDANEYNTLLISSEFETLGAVAVVEPWVLFKATNGGTPDLELWTPLNTVTLVATSTPPHASLGPLEPAYVKAPAAQVEIPNCFKVRLLLKSISAGKIKVWAGLTNRAPR